MSRPAPCEVFVWHKRLKGRSARVSVGRREVEYVNFTFKLPGEDVHAPPPRRRR